MKKILLTILLFTILSVRQEFAVTKTPTPEVKTTETPAVTDADIEKIEKIKEMVASKVAELKLVEKKGIMGVVQEVTNTKLTITDFQGKDRIIEIDELTKFQESAGSSKTFGISDIKKNDSLVFVGLYNKETERLLARFVIKSQSIPDYMEGVVTEKDKENYNLVVKNEKGNEKTVSIETSTKIQNYSKEAGMSKGGFSKINVGDRVLAVGFDDSKNPTILNTTRLLVMPDVPLSADLIKFKNLNEDLESSGSGNKLTPITK